MNLNYIKVNVKTLFCVHKYREEHKANNFIKKEQETRRLFDSCCYMLQQNHGKVHSLKKRNMANVSLQIKYVY